MLTIHYLQSTYLQSVKNVFSSLSACQLKLKIHIIKNYLMDSSVGVLVSNLESSVWIPESEHEDDLGLPEPAVAPAAVEPEPGASESRMAGDFFSRRCRSPLQVGDFCDPPGSTRSTRRRLYHKSPRIRANAGRLHFTSCAWPIDDILEVHGGIRYLSPTPIGLNSVK